VQGVQLIVGFKIITVMNSRSFKIISVIKSRTLRRMEHAARCKTQEVLKKFWLEYMKEQTAETNLVIFMQNTR
jgi:hypothetical protein